MKVIDDLEDDGEEEEFSRWILAIIALCGVLILFIQDGKLYTQTTIEKAMWTHIQSRFLKYSY